MELSAILFDLDGTLVDSLPGIEYSVDYALAENGLPARQGTLRPRIGPPIRHIFSQLAPAASPALLDALERSFRQCYDSEGWRRTLLHEYAAHTLRVLHEAQSKLFVATNKPALATGQILRLFEIEEFFTACVSRNSRTPPYTSKGEMIQDVCRQYRLQPDQCLYVGDTEEDYHAGREAGMPVAIVPHGYGSFDFQHLPASCRALRNLADLLETVETLEIS